MTRIHNLAGLEALVHAVKLGSIAKAALQLRISPPAVSKRISTLERQMRVALLRRSSRKLAPTAEGQLLIDRFEVFARTLESVSEEVTYSRDLPRGTVRVSSTAGFGHQCIVPALASFGRDYPEIEVDLDLDDAYADFIHDGVDVAIRNGRLADADFVARRLGPMELYVCASAQYLAARGIPHRPEDLSGHACINFRLKASGKPFPWEFERAGKRYSMNVHGPVTVSSIHAACEVAALGLGLVQVGGYLARPLIKSGRLVAVLEDFIARDRSHWICYRDRKNLPFRLRAFLEHICRFAGDELS